MVIISTSAELVNIHAVSPLSVVGSATAAATSCAYAGAAANAAPNIANLHNGCIIIPRLC
jgi:hypothetical protein